MDIRTEVKERFEANGETISDWAKRHGYKPRTVYAVLSGQLKAKRGKAHQIAVALGLKAQPNQAADDAIAA